MQHVGMAMEAKLRQSNFELLRILAILMVVMEHFVRQSGLLESGAGAHDSINAFLGSGARIAVNIFILVGSWFMVDADFRPGKALKLYLETAFYCIPITLLMALLGTAGCARNIIQGMLPFFGRPVWFATAYISLMILTPFLNKAFLLPSKAQGRLVGALFVLVCIASTIPSFSNIDYIADLSWFCVVYLGVGWAKRSGLFSKIAAGKWLALATGALIYAGLCLAARTPLLTWPANYWLDNIRTLPNISCALFIFAFFLKTDIGHIKFVNFFSRSVFAVYIVHQVPAFREFLWKTICKADAISTLPPTPYALSIIGVAIAILFSVTVVDLLRIKLFAAVEKRICKGRSK